MNPNPISTRLFCIVSGFSGIVGVIMLTISFNINPGPPLNATLDQITVFGHRYFASILWGAWLQAVGPFFIVLFALALVSHAGATKQLAGLMTLFGACTLMTVSLIEITFYMAALFENPPLSTLMGMNVIHAVQHLYFIIAAPAFFIPLGFVIVSSEILPRVLGYLAILLGAAFAILGVLFLQNLVLPLFVQAFAGIQILWWLSASIALLLRARKLSHKLEQ
jgi:hypothetical protein